MRSYDIVEDLKKCIRKMQRHYRVGLLYQAGGNF